MSKIGLTGLYKADNLNYIVLHEFQNHLVKLPYNHVYFNSSKTTKIFFI